MSACDFFWMPADAGDTAPECEAGARVMAPRGCRACTHAGPLQRHATRDSWWRDVPQGDRPQYRRGHIVRWRCPSCGHTLALQPDWAVPGKRMTRALHDWLVLAQGQGLSARATAARCGLDAKTVRTWLRERMPDNG